VEPPSSEYWYCQLADAAVSDESDTVVDAELPHCVVDGDVDMVPIVGL
jgi:hypothetical protein